jgi:hypothetical protein
MLPDSGSGSGKIIVACCVSCQFVLDVNYLALKCGACKE